MQGIMQGTISGAMPTATFSEDEWDWVMCGLAWVGLYRWRCGTAAGERARAWFEEQMDLRFDAKHAARQIGPGMEALEARLRPLLTGPWDRGGVLTCPVPITDPGVGVTVPATAPARRF